MTPCSDSFHIGNMTPCSDSFHIGKLFKCQSNLEMSAFQQLRNVHYQIDNKILLLKLKSVVCGRSVGGFCSQPAHTSSINSFFILSCFLLFSHFYFSISTMPGMILVRFVPSTSPIYLLIYFFCTDRIFSLVFLIQYFVWQ